MRTGIEKINILCDKTMEYSLYCLIFFLPASKSMIEVCATLGFFAWLVKKINNLWAMREKFKVSSFLDAALIASLLALIPAFFVISSVISTRQMDLSVRTPIPFYPALIVSIFAFFILGIIMASLRNSRDIPVGVKMPFLFFLDIAMITALFTTRHINISMGAFFFKTVEYIVIFFITADVVNKKERLVNVLIAITVSSLIVGLDGFYQLAARFDFLRRFPLYAGKMTASFQFPNNLGAFLITVIFIPLSFIIQGAGRRSSRFILTALTVILVICLLFTRARGAWLGFVPGLFFVCFFSGRRAFFAAIAVLALVVLFSPPIIKHQILSLGMLATDISADDRIAMWRTGWKMFMDSPLIGHGLGTFMNVFGKYKPHSYSEIVYAHNCYLQIVAEMGIAGLIMFLWFVASLIKETVVKLMTADDKFLKAAFTGVGGGIIAYLTHSFVDTNLYSLPLAVLFWMMAGLAAATLKSSPR